MSQDATQDQLRKRLRANTQKLARVDGQQEKLREERAALLREARDAGIGATELAALAGVSRRAVYDAWEG